RRPGRTRAGSRGGSGPRTARTTTEPARRQQPPVAGRARALPLPGHGRERDAWGIVSLRWVRRGREAACSVVSHVSAGRVKRLGRFFAVIARATGTLRGARDRGSEMHRSHWAALHRSKKAEPARRRARPRWVTPKEEGHPVEALFQSRKGARRSDLLGCPPYVYSYRASPPFIPASIRDAHRR